MNKLRSSESWKIVSEGGDEITILQFCFGPEAYKIWKEHYFPAGKEPDVLDDSDPVSNIAPAFAGCAVLPPMAGWIHQAVTNFTIPPLLLTRCSNASKLEQGFQISWRCLREPTQCSSTLCTRTAHSAFFWSSHDTPCSHMQQYGMGIYTFVVHRSAVKFGKT